MKEKRMKLYDIVMNMSEEQQKQWILEQTYIPDLISDMSDEEIEDELLKLT